MSNQTIALVQVSLFKSGSVLDKNGNPAVYLNALAGNLPEKARVVSGTGAQNIYGFQPGNTYTVICTHVSTNELGQEGYNYTVLPADQFTVIFQARQLAGAPTTTVRKVESGVVNNVATPVTPVAQPQPALVPDAEWGDEG